MTTWSPAWTFGLGSRTYGGKTWAWMCDDAIGINTGPYDPNYAYTAAGSVSRPRSTGSP